MNENEEIVSKVRWQIDGRNFCRYSETYGECSDICSETTMCWLTHTGFDIHLKEMSDLEMEGVLF
jgi:hypothetical protein